MTSPFVLLPKSKEETIPSPSRYSDHSLSSKPVKIDFQILFELLEGRAQEVTGRATAQLPSELRERIARFAAGTCPEEEREQMKKMLRETPI